MVLILCFSGLMFILQPAYSQVNPLKKIKQKTDQKLNKEIDKAFDKAFDKNEKKEQDAEAGDKQDAEVQADAGTGKTVADAGTPAVKKEAKPELKWSKYDFVPGDKIIFEDIQYNEENGEFPSRWDLQQGTVENAVLGDENVIMFRGGAPTIIPYLQDPEKDYLPDVFTVDFDLYFTGDNSFTVYLYDRKNQKGTSSGSAWLSIWPNGMDLRPASSKLPDKASVKEKWTHIAIAYTNGKMKAYIDETRLINIPHLEFNPTGISLHAYHAKDNERFYVKNFRIAEGGVKYYDRFLQDGKIVSNGIRFDVGKATLRPESMGPINEIFALLQEHPEVNFSIEGHTDNTGSDESNMTLSAARAETVMNTLADMGISKDRLSSKGWGESKPVSDNGSPEGRANNRRVEFVKAK